MPAGFGQGARSVLASGAMELDPDSLERIVPDDVHPGDATGEDSLRLCLERYGFAARHTRPGRLLDVACGSGYGSRLLADRGPEGLSVLGADLSEAAIAYARKRYGAELVRFVAADAMTLDDRGFDTIVSIETIEHLVDPVRFLARLVEMLRPGGMLIGSVPTTPSVDANPHHLHDFTAGSFRRLGAGRGLVEVDSLEQVQPFSATSVLRRSEGRMKQVRRDLPRYYAAHPDALVRRLWATVRYGFVNRYLTVAWRREG